MHFPFLTASSGVFLERLFVVFFLALVLQNNAFSDEERKEAASRSFSFGVIASLTGPAREQGKSWVEGVELAVLELKTRGVKLKVRYEDDQTNPGIASRAFQRLIAKGTRDGIIGGTWDYLAETLSPLALNRKIPLVTPTNPPELLSDFSQSNDFLFTTGLTLAAEARAVVQFLKDNKRDSAGIFYPNLPWGISHADMMRKVLKEQEVSIVFEEAFNQEGYLTATRIATLKLRKVRPGLLYAPIDQRGLDLLTKEFRKFQYAPLILTTQHLHSAIQLASDPERYSNTFGVYPTLVDARFAEKFRELHGRSPGVYAGAGYDSLLFLVELAQRGGLRKEGLPPFSLEGVTGRIRFPAKNRSLIENQAQVMGLSDFVS